MRNFLSLLTKDLRLMINGRFFHLIAVSLIIYSSYIQLFYANSDQFEIETHLFDSKYLHAIEKESMSAEMLETEIIKLLSDRKTVIMGNDIRNPTAYLMPSGNSKTDNLRIAYACDKTSIGIQDYSNTEIIGHNSKRDKNILEMTSEVLFFELVAIGFLGMASIFFKEKQMGVIKVHGILPVNHSNFIISKLIVFTIADIVFGTLLTLINIQNKFPIIIIAVLIQTGILSIIIILFGLLFAFWLRELRKFSFFYILFTLFATSPVFLATQTNVKVACIKYNPLYYLFKGLKNAFFNVPNNNPFFYILVTATIAILFAIVRFNLEREMVKE